MDRHHPSEIGDDLFTDGLAAGYVTTAGSMWSRQNRVVPMTPWDSTGSEQQGCNFDIAINISE